MQEGITERAYSNAQARISALIEGDSIEAGTESRSWKRGEGKCQFVSSKDLVEGIDRVIASGAVELLSVKFLRWEQVVCGRAGSGSWRGVVCSVVGGRCERE